MEKRQFGNTDMQVSVLGFGGAEIGFEEANELTVETSLHSALDAGLNVIDTGECYRDSEELIEKCRRDEYYLFTKVGHPHGMESAASWSQDSILQSIECSLRRLKTDRLDLVHLHSCSENMLREGALAWVMAQGEDIVPIPGTKRRKYLQENVGALNVSLTSEDLARIDEVAPRDAFAGLRYPESMMAAVNR